MTIVLQGVFALLVALIAIQFVGVVINEGRRRKFFVKPNVARGSYAIAAVATFVLSFHEVSQVATF